MMRKRVAVACVGALSLVGSLWGADQVNIQWNYSDAWTSFWTPADWAAGANWSSGAKPASRGVEAGDAAWFTDVPANAWQFIRIPDAGETFWHYEGAGKHVMLFGGPIATAGIRGSSETWIYCDVSSPNEERFSTQGAVYAGDTSGIGTWQSSGGAYSRLDFWAPSADAVRVNPSCTGTYQNSAGFHLIGAHGNDATNGVWARVAEDARFLTYVSGAKINAGNRNDFNGDFGAGVTVHGAGIAAGTFVRRVYPTLKMIELSAPVDWGEATQVTLDFDAYSPQMRQSIDALERWGQVSIYPFATGTFREQDEYRIEIARLRSQGNLLPVDFRTPDGLTPATIVLHDSAHYFKYGENKPVWISNTHLEFAEPTEAGEVPGLRVCAFCDATTTYKARFTVTNNLAAVIGVFTNFVAMVEKDGFGSLAVSNVTGSATARLIVREGTLSLASPADETAQLKFLEVAPGAAFTVDAGTTLVPEGGQIGDGARVCIKAGAVLDLSGMSIGAGVQFAGEGAVLVRRLDALKGLDMGDLRLRCAATGTERQMLPIGDVAGAVPGDPAFWVDAGVNLELRSVTTTGYGKTEAVTYDNCVSRWGDCRPGHTEYYATNDFTQIATPNGWAPSMLEMLSPGKPYVKHRGNVDFATTAGGAGNYRQVAAGMVWNKPITNIYAVFAVEYIVGDTGQAVLGSTKRFPDVMGTAATVGDFRRGVQSSVDGGGIGT